MAPVPPSGPAAARALDALLADLGDRIQRCDRAPEPPPRLETGLSELDRLLGGGIPLGCLCEITGCTSSGRTSLAQALLAATTRRGECAALVDRADAFDPPSAESAGVHLDRILWVRASSFRGALRCTERLLGTEGFPLVLLDTAQAPALGARRVAEHGERNPAVWHRLARLATTTRSALVLLSPERLAGSQAEIALEMQPSRACFTDAPNLLEALEARAVLVRHRTAPIDRAIPVRLETAAAA